MALDLHEDEAVGKVADRLKDAYHDQYSPASVDATVATARDHFRGAPIRDFIPVLVERRARATLNRPGRAA
ncbi:hypothetical protein ABZ721_34270 [Streptomyces sp. NPDC006733]|uniref:three-helix bundle dimerization domain-containing protein n=1 Tax=Streptomyces sp. NPDC006733 TaxID=3155460 RepID=UPI0033F5F4EB